MTVNWKYLLCCKDASLFDDRAQTPPPDKIVELPVRSPSANDRLAKNMEQTTRICIRQPHVGDEDKDEGEHILIAERSGDTGEHSGDSSTPLLGSIGNDEGTTHHEAIQEVTEGHSTEEQDEVWKEAGTSSQAATTTQASCGNDIRAEPSRRFNFDNEVAEWSFLEKHDEFSETELTTLCRSLNARINHLSGHFIREKNRIRGLQQANSYNPGIDIHNPKVGGDVENRIAELVRKALGSTLLHELSDASKNSGASSSTDASIQDGLDAWSIFCMHLAMKPILFGLRLRTIEEVEEIFRKMDIQEPESARQWNRLRSEDRPTADPRNVKDICPLSRPTQSDMEEYAVLEEIYKRDVVSGHGQQIALHWRALLHKYELDLPSYNEAILQTKEVLSRGLFAIAKVDPSTLSSSFHNRIDKIIEDAASLAKCTRTAIFSQIVETTIVEPGSTFVSASMKSADKGDAGTVKCTIKLGLEVNDAQAGRKLLLMPEVLLT